MTKGIKFLCFCILISSFVNANKIHVDYDKTTNQVIYKGKLYMPLETTKPNVKSFISDEIKTEECNCEEELVTGGKRWFFILMSTCIYIIYIINHSSYFVCWVNVWINSWLSFN